MGCTAIVLENAWRNTAITASAGIDNPEHTKNQLRGLLATTAATAQVSFNFGSTQVIDTLYIAQPSLAFSYRLRLYSELNQAGVVSDTGWISAGGYLPLGVFRVGVDPWGEPTERDFEYLPTMSGMSGILEFQGVTAISHITLGKAWRPSYGASIGVSDDLITGIDWVETVGGSMSPQHLKSPRRQLEFTLNHLSAQERKDFVTQFRRGRGEWVLIDLTAGDLRKEHFAVGALTISPIKWANSNYHSVSCTLMEF